MRFSRLFNKTRKEAPKDEVAKNAELLIRAGFIDKVGAGIYTFLPLGLRVLTKIENIIRDEMNALGAQEIFMPSLHPKENWETTGRWKSMDDLYKLTDESHREFALGATHEEIVVPLAKQFISSYRDLPKAVYQFQTKFRMERRAKSGLLRGREFSMKDLYSFHLTEADFADYYEKMKMTYKNIFDSVGIGGSTYETFASGGTFSKFSHEFQTLTPAGEDTIYLCDNCRIAINREIIEEQTTCPKCGKSKDELREEKAIEVGNIFPLKTRFSDAFNLRVKNERGEETPIVMGCYGIGLPRLMGTIVEVLGDARGIIWPKSVAPFDIHLIEIGGGTNPAVKEKAAMAARKLEERGFSLLHDDRDVSPGVKFADADLIGIPTHVVISERVKNKDTVEVKDRVSGVSKEASLASLFKE